MIAESQTMCHWHEAQRARLRVMCHDWGEAEARWVTDMVSQCLECQGVTQPVQHLSREMPDPSENSQPAWPTSPAHHQPMSRQKRRSRALQKRAVSRRRVVRFSPVR